jgi:hypothetical protein
MYPKFYRVKRSGEFRYAIIMFKLETRRQLVKANLTDDSGIWVERQSLVREDGVRIDRIGSDREMQKHFLYRDDDVSFEFWARDAYWEGGPIEYWDYWEVLLGFAFKMLASSANTPITPAKAKEIARNLEEALMAWPRFPSQPTIRQVKFWMEHWPLWKPAWGEHVTASDLDALDLQTS